MTAERLIVLRRAGERTETSDNLHAELNRWARWMILFRQEAGCERTHRLECGWGVAALALFAAVFFTAGMISLAFILLKLAIPEWAR